MTTLESLLEGYDIFEQRSALYYLGRFVKQADTFEDYKKDIFVEGQNSVPSERVVALTYDMIDCIEKTAGKKASQFNEDEFHFWMDKIAQIEDSIDIEPSEEQIQKAITELNKFEVPKGNDTN